MAYDFASLQSRIRLAKSGDWFAYFFFNDTATTENYNLSLHDALPIYPTLLKVMPWPAQGLARITQWKRRVGTIPLVAVGGLTLERLPGVFAAGADVAAVVTDIVRHLNPEARVREWLSAARAA